MERGPAYQVRLDDPAVKRLRRLPSPDRARIEAALRGEAARAAEPSAGRGGKSVKTIRGRRHEYQRLRVGDWRILFELDRRERVLLVLGIVPRRDLDRWLRAR